MAGVIDQANGGYSDVFIDSNARSGIDRTAVKKPSADMFCVS
ncbi:MAG TPA: hypothetical protein VK254_01065 [Candidatus Bathyarchaeia archaeon]|nr:hypothetical protein [Candidatus Bathyarchaeia archaeon]